MSEAPGEEKFGGCFGERVEISCSLIRSQEVRDLETRLVPGSVSPEAEVSAFLPHAVHIITLYYVIIYKLITSGLSLVLDPATQRGLHLPGLESRVPSPTRRPACRLGWGVRSVLGPGSVKCLFCLVT